MLTQTKSLVESSLLVGLAVVMFLASHVLPVIGVIFSFLCPAPLVILGLRHDLKKASLGVMVASFIVMAFLGPVGAMFFLFGFGVLGVGLGFLAKRYTSGVEIILFGILISLGSKLLLMVIVSKLSGINPFSMDPSEMTGMVDKVFAFYAERGMSGDTLETIRDQVYNSIRMIPLIFPALLSMAAAVDCYLSYMVSSMVMKRIHGTMLPPLPSFSQWRFPKSIFLALVVSLVFSLVGGQGQWNTWTKIGTNLRLLVNIVFLLQGLSLVWFYLASKNVFSLLKGIIIVLILFIPILSQLVLLLGIIDMWFDIRTRFAR